jgi:hypothetical protein
VESEISLSVDDAPSIDQPGPDTTSPAPQAEFAADEIDGLVGEVEDVPDVQSSFAAGESETEQPEESIDDRSSAEPETELAAEQDAATEMEDDTPAKAEQPPSIAVDVEAIPGQGTEPQSAVELTEADLFEDPSLEIAHLAAGQMREVVIPVQIAGEGESFRRYKLSLRLKLDPVD